MLGSLLAPGAAIVQGAHTADTAQRPWIKWGGALLAIAGLYYLATRVK